MMNNLIHSHNDWDKLEAVALGTAESSNLSKSLQGDLAKDLENLTSLLKEHHVEVYSTVPQKPGLEFSNGDWKTLAHHQLFAKEHTLILGDRLIECPLPFRSRMFETFGLKHLYEKAFDSGARWVCPPRPQFSPSEFERPKGPYFMGTCVLRVQENELIYRVSDCANLMGAQWLQSYLGKNINVHIIDKSPRFHIVKPGLLLVDHEGPTPLEVPEFLQDWDKIYLSKNTLPLMLRPDCALVVADDQDLKVELENFGVEVLPIRLRNYKALGGALYELCLDLKRTKIL